MQTSINTSLYTAAWLTRITRFLKGCHCSLISHRSQQATPSSFTDPGARAFTVASYQSIRAINLDLARVSYEILKVIDSENAASVHLSDRSTLMN